MEDIDWIGMAQKVGMAIIILIVTWIIAKVVKWAIGKVVGRVSFLQKQDGDGASTGESIGSIGSLIVWLFGLVAILQVFALDAVLTPIQELLSTLMGFLPNVIGAAVVFFIGFVIAKIAKQLIASAIGMLNFNSIAGKMKQVDPTSGAGATPTPAQPSGAAEAQAGAGMNSRKIGSMVGNLVFAVILIVVGIAALQILDISVISDPAEQMLTMILNAIPMIIAALVLLGIGVLIAKFVGGILEATLRGLGTDRAATNLGILSADKSASTILTRVAQVAIVVFFGIMAAQALGFPEISDLLNTVFALGGRVLFGVVIVAVGFLIAKLVSSAMGAGTGSTVAKYVIIGLFAAIGLKYMGIADSIITLGFGAVVVGGALAAALAFGLGGRDAAARVLAEKDPKKHVTPE
ncbi:MAG: mechanosensitive ion channel [Arthrobacter sp.]|uniref:mechanosensitive ion channel n=1 Tax=unclassified Arthrobacter TaxID=235627 RepID=UPI003FB785D7